MKKAEKRALLAAIRWHRAWRSYEMNGGGGSMFLRCHRTTSRLVHALDVLAKSNKER